MKDACLILLAFACARKALGIEGIRGASPEQCQDRMGAAPTAASLAGAGDGCDDEAAPVAWTAAHGPWNVLPAMAPLNSIGRVVLAGSIVAACLLAHAAAAAPAGVATAPTCRELERRLDLIKPEAKST